MKKKNLFKLLLAVIAITITIVSIDNFLYNYNHSKNLIENRIKTDNARANDSTLLLNNNLIKSMEE